MMRIIYDRSNVNRMFVRLRLTCISQFQYAVALRVIRSLLKTYSANIFPVEEC